MQYLRKRASVTGCSELWHLLAGLEVGKMPASLSSLEEQRNTQMVVDPSQCAQIEPHF